MRKWFVVGLLMGMSLVASAETPSAQKDDYPYLDYGAISRASSSDSETPSRAKKKKSKKEEKAELPTWQQAFKELSVPTKERSANLSVTPATVSTKVEAVESPIRWPSYQVDFALEAYRPAGQMKLPGFDAYELDALGIRPMPSLAMRWLPLQSKFGVYASGAYTQQAVSLIGPTGEAFRAATLSTLMWQAGGVWAHPFADSGWGARFEPGVGEIRVIQSSGTSFANHAASETFLSFAVYGERRIWNWVSGFIGYDHRIPVGAGADEIELSRANFRIGLSGGFH